MRNLLFGALLFQIKLKTVLKGHPFNQGSVLWFISADYSEWLPYLYFDHAKWVQLRVQMEAFTRDHSDVIYRGKTEKRKEKSHVKYRLNPVYWHLLVKMRDCSRSMRQELEMNVSKNSAHLVDWDSTSFKVYIYIGIESSRLTLSPLICY